MAVPSARGGIALLAACVLVLASVPIVGASGSSAYRSVAACSAAIRCGSAGDPARQLLAYVRGTVGSAASVWIAGANGGRARRLGAGRAPLVSPDGSWVAASRPSSRGRALVVYSSRQVPQRRFFDAAGVAAAARTWSADSRYLAVVLSGADPGSSRSGGLAVIDTLTGGVRTIAHGPISGASFAPDGSDRIVYDHAHSLSISAAVDLYASDVNGQNKRRLTRDGRSLNPVWGSRTIAFDRETFRGEDLPAYQIWQLRRDGRGRRQVTHVRIPSLMSGLVPTEWAGDGIHLLAEFEGLNTSQAWVITAPAGRARELRSGGESVVGAAISRDGASVLVDQGGFLNPIDAGRVESIPLVGSGGRVLAARGSEPSWNR
jgi:hypothetical protein